MTQFSGDTGQNVIYDFVDVNNLPYSGNLYFNGGWSGTILAPLATVTNQGGNFDGTIVVQSLTQQFELHQNNLFAGNLGLLAAPRVPEPGSLALIALGLGLAVFSSRWRPAGLARA